MKAGESTLQRRGRWRRPLFSAVLLGLCALRCEVPLAPEPLQRFTTCDALQGDRKSVG